jgi:hypothetical protein
MIKSHYVGMVALLGVCGIACGKESQACHYRQARAKDNLSALHTAETKFRERTGKFTGSFAELGFTTPEPEDYTLAIDSATDVAYHATATGKGAAKGDVWTIDQLGNPVVSVDGCK